jgi:hypothetical protein
VVWRDTDGAQRDVRGQRLNQTGGLLGGLDICTEASSQWSPAVAYSPGDDLYLVVWPDDRDSAAQGRNIYGRQVGGGGALQPEFAISTASGAQAAPGRMPAMPAPHRTSMASASAAMAYWWTPQPAQMTHSFSTAAPRNPQQ